MPETTIEPSGVKKVLVGTWNAVKPENQGKAVMRVIDRYFKPKFETEEDRKLAEKIAGWTAVGLEAVGAGLVTFGIVKGYRLIKQSRQEKELVQTVEKINTAKVIIANVLRDPKSDKKTHSKRKLRPPLLRDEAGRRKLVKMANRRRPGKAQTVTPDTLVTEVDLVDDEPSIFKRWEREVPIKPAKEEKFDDEETWVKKKKTHEGKPSKTKGEDGYKKSNSKKALPRAPAPVEVSDLRVGASHISKAREDAFKSVWPQKEYPIVMQSDAGAATAPVVESPIAASQSLLDSSVPKQDDPHVFIRNGVNAVSRALCDEKPMLSHTLGGAFREASESAIRAIMGEDPLMTGRSVEDIIELKLRARLPDDIKGVDRELAVADLMVVFARSWQDYLRK